jgi:RES domain-containing protein
MTAAFVSVRGRFWRMLNIRFQTDPLSGEGARRFGGRWNKMGVPALYLGADHSTTIAEFYQKLDMPGTIVPYDVESGRVADLTDGKGSPCGREIEAALAADWIKLARIDSLEPPSWLLADRLIAAGADGALVPSAQRRGGTNLVLWRWSADGSEGARVRVIDPFGDLR